MQKKKKQHFKVRIDHLSYELYCQFKSSLSNTVRMRFSLFFFTKQVKNRLKMYLIGIDRV